MPDNTANPSTRQVNEPMQLIEFSDIAAGGTRIKLKHDTIDSICIKIGNRPICIIDVCGPSRQGKSFLLGYVIRKLEALEQGKADWMGRTDDKRPLEGFKFRNGDTPETQGIWVWSKPFIIKGDDGKEVAVLLVDTQGTNDEFTTSKDMAAIVGLSLLMSSVMVFNHFTNLQEDILSALNTYIQYGSLALDEDNYSGYPFQKLNFLIRDWNNPDQFQYGAKGGEQFLNRKLQVKPSQPDEAKHVRQTIRSCFEEVGCFLMPYIGEEAKRLKFTGSVSELAPEFAKKLEEFINSLVCQESIVTKKFLDSPVTPSELKTLLVTFIDIFNSDEVPSAESMWNATSRLSNTNVVEKAMKKYHDMMETALDAAASYLSDEALKRIHLEGLNEAMKVFKSARKVGSPELISEFQANLSNSVEEAFADLKEKNEHNRDKFISEAATSALEEFRVQLQNQFQFEEEGDHTDFYDHVKIKQAANLQKSAVLATFKRKLSNEEGAKLRDHVQSVEESLEDILSALLNSNKVFRAIAERKMTSVVEGLASSHRSKVGNFLELNKYEGDEAKLRNGHALSKNLIIQEYQQQAKPGDAEFHHVYQAMLEGKMEETFGQLKSKHMLHIQEVKADAKKCVAQCNVEYRQLLHNQTGSAKTLQEFLRCHENAKDTVTQKLRTSVSVKDPIILSPCETELNGLIQVSFSEGKKYFESIQAESAAKTLAEEKAREAREAEAATRAAEAGQQRIQMEAENARIRAEAENARIQAEAQVAAQASALQAEIEKQKIQAEAQATAHAAALHAANLQAQLAAANAGGKNKDIFQRIFGW